MLPDAQIKGVEIIAEHKSFSWTKALNILSATSGILTQGIFQPTWSCGAIGTTNCGRPSSKR
jgi:hypothetical protein